MDLAGAERATKVATHQNGPPLQGARATIAGEDVLRAQYNLLQPVFYGPPPTVTS